MSPPTKDPLQGEGDKISARQYNRDLREFISEGKVDEAAEDAKLYVERAPDDAEKAEEKAKRGPRSKRTIIDRIRPYIAKLRSKLGHK